MTVDVDSAGLREQYVAELRSAGRLRSPRWIEAFAQVPREHFVPRFAAPQQGGQLVDHDLADPDALAVVYSNAPLITQRDAVGAPTSSSTQPSLMATMLEHLDARPGHRVLEIGTGTGYNAALLCHALGSDAVTSIDLDGTVAESAEQRLRELGCTPRIAVAEAQVGAPEHAPFDRVIGTCGFTRVPKAWLGQLAEDGVVVLALGCGLVVLRGGPGGLRGPVVGPAGFMSRSSVDEVALTPRDLLTTVQALPPADRSERGMDRSVFHDPDFSLLRMLCLPTTHAVLRDEEDGSTTYFLHDPARGVSTRAHVLGDTAQVSTRGGDDLWAELLAVQDRWREHGCPELTRFGVSVHADGSHDLWLDEPGVVVCRRD